MLDSSNPLAAPSNRRFRPLTLIGSGSMGTVYKVFDNEIGVAVALKTLQDFAPEQLYRLKNEFRALTGVIHPNLVQLFELHVDGHLHCFTMEYIEGTNFIEYVRSRAGSDDFFDHFIHAAVQLLCGLRAVHAAGRLHRDLKPSNIRVTPDGRVVILDFDLVVAIGQEGSSVLPSSSAGSFAYMPPEALWGRPVNAASDIYSAGVLFYEGLSGRAPFKGIPSAGRARPVPLSRQIPFAIPAEMETLLLQMIESEPDQRPALEVVLECLRKELPADSRVDRFLRGHREFVGREHEMKALQQAYSQLSDGRVVSVSLTGSSGMGKTELARRFLDLLEAEEDTLILRGRCHPQESVPFKALDAVVDGLANELSRQSAEELRRLRPMHGDALARLFPVLGRIPEITGDASSSESLDDSEIRHRAVDALRQLLTNLSDRRRVVVWIDDLQWGDRDSAGLLADLLRPPKAPPLFLLSSYRSDDEDKIEVLRAVESVLEEDGIRSQRLTLSPLPPAIAVDLARRLCPGHLANIEIGLEIARQSGGAPFLVAEMARYLHHRPWPSSADARAIDFADAIGNRLGDLPAKARRLVELIAVASSPVERSVLLQASHDGEPGRAILALLESQCLVRVTPRGPEIAIEAYHDRIREGVLTRLGDDQLADCHLALASALEASKRATAEELANHFHGAGQLRRAAEYAVTAAEKAMSTLAFTHAADLYRKAREWDERDSGWRRDLLTREGHALTSAARFEEAAHLFLAAAPGAERVEGLDLRRRASEQWLSAGKLDEGTNLLAQVLSEIGLTYPTKPAQITWGIARRLIGFLLHGIEPRPRSQPPTREELLRADICYSAGKCLVDADSMLGVYFLVYGLEEALRVGEPIRLGCALAVVGGCLSVLDSGIVARLGRRMIEAADRLESQTNSPLIRGTIDVAGGQVLVLSGKWHLARERCDSGARVLAENCHGTAYESLAARVVALRAGEELGDMNDLQQRAWDLIAQANSLRDHYTEIGASISLAESTLANHDPRLSRSLAEKATHLWTREGFHIQHLYSLRAQLHCDLYEGKVAHAFRRWEETWPTIRGSGLLRVSLPRIDSLGLRGRLSVALSREEPHRRNELLRLARKAARQLRRERRPDALVHASMVEAAIAHQRDRPDLAIRALEGAAATARAEQMRLRALIADYRRGRLLGGPFGRELVETSHRAMIELGVAQPDRWAAVHAPGFFD